FVGGALGVLGFAPFHFWPAALASIAALFALWLRPSRKRGAFAIGFFWGLGLFLAGVSWIYVSLHVYGNVPAVLAGIATLLFCTYLALFPALGGMAFLWIRQRRRATATRATAIDLLLAMPACFVASEMLRGWFLSGFPWLTMGYSQTPGGFVPAPLMGFAPLIGTFGTSWLMALIAAMTVLLIPCVSPIQISRRGARWATGAIIGVCLLGAALQHVPWSAPAGAPVSVSLLQGNIEQSLKWREDQRVPTLTNYLELAKQSKAKLVVMPETALPTFLDAVPQDYLDRLRVHTAARGADLIFGAPIAERAANEPATSRAPYRYFNSAISLGASTTQRYDKSHLVAFGEFIPPLFSWVYRWLDIPLAGFTEGTTQPQPMNIAGTRVAVNICYEDAFGAEIARQLPEANLLVNISNMAWYGQSLAADQHAQMAQMRAMETSRWMLRSTNTGVTAAIDHTGHIVNALPQFTRGALNVEAEPRTGTTPYTIWRDWPVLLGLILVIGAVATGARKTKVQ
ncbi:MAG: apolipoprotein N-acyltransferase, partial [Betaproteobacteria bacterium]|nr:apolipoprotein N-acyltransferase [Betaproteobacteria bacterium]